MQIESIRVIQMIDNFSRISKHIQTANILKSRIRVGDYQPGASLPPVRNLGAELGVSVNVIQRAFHLLEKDGFIKKRQGVGVQVSSELEDDKAPLTFGLVYPFSPDSAFAGSVHCFAEKAIDLENNHCIIKSSGNNPMQERKVVEQFLNNTIEGLLVWPCDGNENAEFFQAVSKKIPLVFVDRTFPEVQIPGVVMDCAGAGRDMVLHLGRQGWNRILVLVDPIKISTFQEMYQSMRDTTASISANHRFDFVDYPTSEFFDRYLSDPCGVVEDYTRCLEKILKADKYDAVFCPHDEFLDRCYASTGLAALYPYKEIVSVSNTRPTPRTIAFYRLGVREWICDFETMIRKATEMLHSIVLLKSRIYRQVRIKYSTVIRTSDQVI
jgi:DNA-binding LacI/PurR family transcriptional regulator